MTAKEKFIEMSKDITRPGIDRLMAWLETTDFYEAPASTRFHSAEPGGLCAHSVAVAKRLLEIADLWAPGQYTRDTLLTVALFHDLCKVFTYTVSTRNVKDEVSGQWTKVPFYKFEPKESVGCDSHGSLSCYRIMSNGVTLSMEEYAAVNNHMGVTNAANVNSVWSCYEMHTLSWLLHAGNIQARVALTASDELLTRGDRVTLLVYGYDDKRNYVWGACHKV